MLKQWRQTLGYCSIFAAIPAILATHVSEARSDEVKRTEASVAGRGAQLFERLNLSYSNPGLLKRQSEFRRDGAQLHHLAGVSRTHQPGGDTKEV